MSPHKERTILADSFLSFSKSKRGGRAGEEAEGFNHVGKREWTSVCEADMGCAQAGREDKGLLASLQHRTPEKHNSSNPKS